MATRPRMASPDGVLAAQLSGAPQWVAPIASAVAELRDMAGGRADLLAETAGTLAGAWSAQPDVDPVTASSPQVFWF